MTSEQNQETPGFFPDCQKWPHAEVDCRGDNAEDHDPSRPVHTPRPIQDRIDAIYDRHAPANVSELASIQASFRSAYLAVPSTDDEREELAAIVDQNADVNNPTFHRNTAAAILAAGFHRTVQGEHQKMEIYDGNETVCVTCPRNSHGEYVAWDQAHPQGEPSDAAVEAALAGWRNEWNSDDMEAMRAALIAAAAVQGGETR